MPSATLHLLRSRWLTWGVHVGLWVLLYLTVVHSGGKTPELIEASASTPSALTAVPVARIDSLFSPGQWTTPLTRTKGLNPFFTHHFVPPSIPTPPPPTTKKVDATYQGFFQTGDNPRQAIVKIGDAFVVASVGAAVVTNQFVADATMQNLILTNSTQTNMLPLNAKRELEVPIK
jgi:hypothetical protein